MSNPTTEQTSPFVPETAEEQELMEWLSQKEETAPTNGAATPTPEPPAQPSPTAPAAAASPVAPPATTPPAAAATPAPATPAKRTLADIAAQEEAATPAASAAPAVTKAAAQKKSLAEIAEQAAAQSETEDHEPLVIDASEIVTDWTMPGWHPVEVVKSKKGTSKNSGNPQFEVIYRCLAGPDASSYHDDFLPLAGNGLKKTAKWAGCVGLRDREKGNLTFPAGAMSLLGKRLWVDVVEKEETYTDPTGNEVTRTRMRIDFAGYKPLLEGDLPAEGDLFTNA